MEPKSSCRPTIIVIVLVVLATVHSLPTGRREAPPTPDQPIAVNKLIRSLTTITNSNDNLYFLWEEAIYLTNENLMMAEYQQKERKVCRGRALFNDMTGQEENCGVMTTLEYGQLTKYYNELVIQLKLAEMIVNDSSLIAREVVEVERADVVDIERNIIQLLNKTVLPVLEFYIQQLAANGTDCSTTEAIVDQTTAIYANCAAIQTSNLFLAQIALDLYHNLNYTINESDAIIDNSPVTLPEVTDSKEWCIIRQ